MSRFTCLGLVAPFLLFQGEDRVMEMGAHRLLLLCGGVLLPLSAKKWAGLAGDSHAGRSDDRKDCIARNRLSNNKSNARRSIPSSVACGLSHPISCTSLMSCLHYPISHGKSNGHSQNTSPILLFSPAWICKIKGSVYKNVLVTLPKKRGVSDWSFVFTPYIIVSLLFSLLKLWRNCLV